MLSRLFPHPLLTLVLAVVWLLLVNTVTLNAIVFGLLLGLLLPQAIRAYWPDMPTLRNPVAIAGYILIVLLDIVKANIQVALIVLFKPAARLQPAWIRVPLDLTKPEAITVLAGTITVTPGTVSCDLADDGHALLVHCLHAPEPAAVVDEIKHRYERRLKEIFE